MMSHHVLIVAQDDFVSGLVSDLLEANDLRTHRARTAGEAVNLARDVQPAMVLVDAGAEPTTASAVLEGLRRRPDTREIPVMTLESGAGRVSERAIGAVSASVCHPIDTAEFPRRVMQELRRHTTNPGRRA